ncbi:diphosphomevalonate decarboxylase [Wenzhouxiangella limi]|uniref:diphosphomevalonate decarboxylase n=1 Tax=Wenzhouxiangella limi TaxID=2707351 RepID=A0A845UYW0_9GAMM|nr:diphosphomevalonate decarboxylase [Wenzhouxiangella limi]NDY97013.1 diphosphomevalonate decarboxylase [Wenzhouxiangella limi]
MNTATARAGANIALVKYWGKRDPRLNLPAAGSLSITLADLETVTRIEVDQGLDADRFELDGRSADPRPVAAVLDLLRPAGGPRCRVVSRNNFPTGAGLASSASGHAALVVAAAAIFCPQMGSGDLAAIARRGSGSASRSLFGGFCQLHAGVAEDGSDCRVEGLEEAGYWPLEVVVAITDAGPKAVSSRAGMNRTMATSPYYPAWVASVSADLERARRAVADRDFDELAEVSEHSALKMHASALAAQPGLLYWNAATVACLRRVRELRDQGVGVFFTVDAGPQVKAVCLPGQADRVAASLASIAGVEQVLRSGLGPGARLVES